MWLVISLKKIPYGGKKPVQINTNMKWYNKVYIKITIVGIQQRHREGMWACVHQLLEAQISLFSFLKNDIYFFANGCFVLQATVNYCIVNFQICEKCSFNFCKFEGKV